MQQGVGFLVKIFSSEQYRNDFLKGNLYMNPLEFFINYEDKHSGNVGDKHEALSAWLPPEGISIKIKFGDTEFVIPGSDLAAPVTIRRNRFNSVNVFCMMALHSHGMTVDQHLDDKQVALLEEYFTIPDDVVNLGEYAVIIPNVNIFFDRLRDAAQTLVDNGEAKKLQAEFVTYYDDAQALSLTDEELAIFHKQKNYEHQKEFRICLERDVEDASPYTLHVGDLSGIAFPIMTKDLMNHFKLEISPAIK